MKTRVIFLLDKSGSMRWIHADTVGGFGTYVETLRNAPEADDISLSLIQFDSTAIITSYKDKPIKEVPELTFTPGDMTPLIEAMVKTIEAAASGEGTGGQKTIFVAMTDGDENSSRPEYTNERLAALIAEKRGQGWEFIFLGAGIDAYRQASKLGIGAGQTMSYDAKDAGATFSAYASAAGQSLRGARGMSMSFSDQDKAAAGDAFAPNLVVEAAAPVSTIPLGTPVDPAKVDRLRVDL